MRATAHHLWRGLRAESELWSLSSGIIENKFIVTTHHSATDCCDYEGSSIMTSILWWIHKMATQLLDSTRTSPNTQSVSLISGHLAGVPGHHTVILSYPPRTWIWPNSCVLLTKWSLWQIAGQNRPTHDSLSDQHLYMELIFCIGIHKNPKYLSVSHCSHETVSSLQLPGTGQKLYHDMTSVMCYVVSFRGTMIKSIYFTVPRGM